MNIQHTSLRLIAFVTIEGTIVMSFANNNEIGHRQLYQNINEEVLDSRNFDIPIYGRFYALLYANSRRPQIIIYGNSSDYDDIEELGHHKDTYEMNFREYARGSNMDILFLP